MTETNYYDLILQEDLNLGIGDGTRRNPSGGAVMSVTQIGLHTFAVGQVSVNIFWEIGTLGSLATVSSDAVDMPGAFIGSFVFAQINVAKQGCIVTAEVLSDQVIRADIFNPTQNPIVFGTVVLGLIAFLPKS